MTSTANGPTQSFETTLSTLYLGEQPNADIIAVEALGQKPLECWTEQQETGDLLWLRDSDFLPAKLPRSRILSFGYTVKETLRLSAISKALLKMLEDHRQREDEVITDLKHIRMN